VPSLVQIPACLSRLSLACEKKINQHCKNNSNNNKEEEEKEEKEEKEQPRTALIPILSSKLV
jgi:hypothetical protein